MKKTIISLFGLLSILTCAANTTFINYEIPCDGEVFAEADGLIYYIEQAPFATVVDIADSATDVVIPEKVTINGVEYDVYPKLSKYPIYSYLGIAGYTDAADIYCLVEPTYPDEVLCNGNQTLKSLNTGPITNIDGYFFKNYTALESVTMPDVTNLGVESFRGCAAIENVEVPNVLYLHKSCFRDCTSLKNCVLPSVSEVEPYIFRDCTSIESIIFESPEVMVHENVYPYSEDDDPYTDGMFAGCTSLRRIIVKGMMTPPHHNHEIGLYAGLRADGLQGCSAIEELYINNDMRYTQNMIADAPNLKSIIIGNNRITHLEPDAITGCDIHEIHCMFPIPPVRYNPEDEPIEVDKQTCVVYVPKGCLDIYTHADYWSEFANIVEDPEVELPFDLDLCPPMKIGTDKNNTYRLVG